MKSFAAIASLAAASSAGNIADLQKQQLISCINANAFNEANIKTCAARSIATLRPHALTADTPAACDPSAAIQAGDFELSVSIGAIAVKQTAAKTDSSDSAASGSDSTASGTDNTVSTSDSSSASSSGSASGSSSDSGSSSGSGSGTSDSSSSGSGSGSSTSGSGSGSSTSGGSSSKTQSLVLAASESQTGSQSSGSGSGTQTSGSGSGTQASGSGSGDSSGSGSGDAGASGSDSQDGSGAAGGDSGASGSDDSGASAGGDADDDADEGVSIDALEIDFSLSNTAGTGLADGNVVFMYASLQSNLDDTRWETSTCTVTYSDATASADPVELDAAGMQSVATIATFIGTKNFKEGTNGDATCTVLGSLNPTENQGAIDADEDGWTHNVIDTLGYSQTKIGSGDNITTTVNCATWSSRTDTAEGFAYKIGETVKIGSGFKVRASATSESSLFASDSAPKDFKLLDMASASAISAVAVLAAAALAF